MSSFMSRRASSPTETTMQDYESETTLNQNTLRAGAPDTAPSADIDEMDGYMARMDSGFGSEKAFKPRTLEKAFDSSEKKTEVQVEKEEGTGDWVSRLDFDYKVTGMSVREKYMLPRRKRRPCVKVTENQQDPSLLDPNLIGSWGSDLASEPAGNLPHSDQQQQEKEKGKNEEEEEEEEDEDEGEEGVDYSNKIEKLRYSMWKPVNPAKVLRTSIKLRTQELRYLFSMDPKKTPQSIIDAVLCVFVDCIQSSIEGTRSTRKKIYSHQFEADDINEPLEKEKRLRYQQELLALTYAVAECGSLIRNDGRHDRFIRTLLKTTRWPTLTPRCVDAITRFIVDAVSAAPNTADAIVDSLLEQLKKHSMQKPSVAFGASNGIACDRPESNSVGDAPLQRVHRAIAALTYTAPLSAFKVVSEITNFNSYQTSMDANTNVYMPTALRTQVANAVTAAGYSKLVPKKMIFSAIFELLVQLDLACGVASPPKYRAVFEHHYTQQIRTSTTVSTSTETATESTAEEGKGDDEGEEKHEKESEKENEKKCDRNLAKEEEDENSISLTELGNLDWVLGYLCSAVVSDAAEEVERLKSANHDVRRRHLPERTQLILDAYMTYGITVQGLRYSPCVALLAATAFPVSYRTDSNDGGAFAGAYSAYKFIQRIAEMGVKKTATCVVKANVVTGIGAIIAHYKNVTPRLIRRGVSLICECALSSDAKWIHACAIYALKYAYVRRFWCYHQHGVLEFLEEKINGFGDTRSLYPAMPVLKDLDKMVSDIKNKLADQFVSKEDLSNAVSSRVSLLPVIYPFGPPPTEKLTVASRILDQLFE